MPAACPPPRRRPRSAASRAPARPLIQSLAPGSRDRSRAHRPTSTRSPSSAAPDMPEPVLGVAPTLVQDAVAAVAAQVPHGRDAFPVLAGDRGGSPPRRRHAGAATTLAQLRAAIRAPARPGVPGTPSPPTPRCAPRPSPLGDALTTLDDRKRDGRSDAAVAARRDVHAVLRRRPSTARTTSVWSSPAAPRRRSRRSHRPPTSTTPSDFAAALVRLLRSRELAAAPAAGRGAHGARHPRHAGGDAAAAARGDDRARRDRGGGRRTWLRISPTTAGSRP